MHCNPITHFDPLGLNDAFEAAWMAERVHGNDPPPKPWTLMIGVSKQGGVVAGGTKGVGRVWGINSRKNDSQIGSYSTTGVATDGRDHPYMGVGGAATLDISVSGNDDIKALGGESTTTGGGGGEGWGGGLEKSTPVRGDAKPYYTLSLGLSFGFPFEVHRFKTTTDIYPDGENPGNEPLSQSSNPHVNGAKTYVAPPVPSAGDTSTPTFVGPPAPSDGDPSSPTFVGPPAPSPRDPSSTASGPPESLP